MSLISPHKLLEATVIQKTDENIKKYPLEYKSPPTLWRIISLVSIVSNYLLASVSYLLLKSDERTYFFILTLDIIYVVDYLIALVDYTWKQNKFYVNKTPTRNKTLFIIDLFLLFPFSYIYKAYSYDSYNYYLFLILRANVLFRLFHVLLFFKMKWNTPAINHIKYFSLFFAAFFVIILHTSACVWFAIIFDNESTPTWRQIIDLKNKYQLIAERYVISCYYTLSCFANRIFGDIIPLDTPQKFLVVLFKCSGFILTTVFLIGTLSFLIGHKYNKKTDIRSRLQRVLRFFKSISSSAKDLKLIESYYKTFWEKKKGISESPQFGLLPCTLKDEICMDINTGFFRTSTLFKDKQLSFLRMVSNFIRHEFYQRGDRIYHRNVVKNKMIYVAVGVIEILSDEDDESRILELEAGSCLGESALVLGIPAKASVRASCYTELQILHKKDFIALIDFYPVEYKRIRNNILNRIVKAQSEESNVDENMEWTSFFFKKQDTALQNLKKDLNTEDLSMKNSLLSLYKLKGKFIDYDSKICVSETFPWIWNPTGLARQLWEVLIIILVLYISVTHPYFIIFKKEYSSWFKFISNFIDIIFIIDILIILTTAVEQRDKTIRTFTSITQKRLTEPGFYLDFISSIKIELFYWIWTRNQRFKQVLKLNRLVKIYRIPKAIGKIQNGIEIDCGFLSFAKYLFFVLIYAYWGGAFLYLTACFDDRCTEDGWFFTKIMNDSKNEYTVFYTNDEILTSVYFALSCLTGLTVGDIVPKNITDYAVTSILYICGIFTFAYFVAQVAASFLKNAEIKTDFQVSLYKILKCMKKENLGKDLLKRIRNYLVIQWRYGKYGGLKKQSLFCDMNEDLQNKIQIQNKMETISGIRLFQNITADFLISLAKKSKIFVLPPNEYIIYKGELTKNLYIIINGYCVRQFEKSCVLLKPKTLFGTMGMFSKVNSLCTVKTITHVKLLLIPEDDFWESASMYPLVTTNFKTASERFDILGEFNRIPVQAAFSGIADSDDYSAFKGSIINVITYSKKYNESYSEPFRKLGITCWVQLLLLPICILPNGFFLKFWLLLRLLTAILIFLLTPFQIIHTSRNLTISNTLFVADLISYTDLYVMMYVGYHQKNTNHLIIHPLKTALHYIKKKFIFDFVLCFPWEIFVLSIIEKNQILPNQNSFLDFHNVIRFIRMGQIYRLPQFYNFVMDTKATVKDNFILLIKYLPIIFLFVHFWATIVMANSCKNISNFKLERSDNVIYCNKDSWIDKSKFNSSTTPFEIYTLAIYFCTQMVTLCGLGDITPQYPSTVMIVSCMIISGVLFIGYMFAKIASIKAYRHYSLYESQERISELKYFMISENVDKNLQTNTFDQLEYQYTREKCLKYWKILKNLHPALYQDVTSTIYENILKITPMFDNVDKLFLRVFGKLIEERHYYRKETIYQVDDVVSEICIVEKGVVKIISKSRSIQSFMEMGGIFGNITPNAKHKISVTAIALTNVDLLVLRSDVFFSVLNNYPLIKITIQNNIMGRSAFILPKFKSDEVHEIEAGIESEETSESIPESYTGTRRDVYSFFSLCIPWYLFRVVISQYSVFYKISDIYCIILSYLNALFITYECIFRDHQPFFLYFAIYVDVTFIAKLILDMHITYENQYGGVITSNHKIFQRYFFSNITRRLMDFIINFPLYYTTFFVALFVEFNANFIFCCWRIITLLRLLHITDYLKKNSNKLRAKKIYLKISSTIIWCFFVIHILACGWYLCACSSTTCSQDSWMKDFLPNEKKIKIYVTCVYFITTLLTKTGTGDIVANNIQEQIFITIVLMITIIIIGICIGEMWNCLNSLYVGHMKYDKAVKELKCNIRNNNVSLYQFDKISRYIQQLWSTNKGRQMPKALSKLHPTILKQIMVDIYAFHLENSHIFSDVEKAFIRQLCQHLKRTVFFPGNYIVQHGDFDNSLYFIHFGEVDILTIHSNLTETIHEVLHTGEMFGVIQGLYEKIPHHFSYRARTIVHVVSLQLSDWEYLLNFFPQSKESIFVKTNKVNI